MFNLDKYKVCSSIIDILLLYDSEMVKIMHPKKQFYACHWIGYPYFVLCCLDPYFCHFAYCTDMLNTNSRGFTCLHILWRGLQFWEQQTYTCVYSIYSNCFTQMFFCMGFDNNGLKVATWLPFHKQLFVNLLQR